MKKPILQRAHTTLQPGISRRRLLGVLANLGAGLVALPLLSGSALAEAPAPAPAPKATGPDADKLMRPIPASGQLVPAIGLGTARTFSLSGLTLAERSRPVEMLDVDPQVLNRLQEVLRLFYAEGGRLVDSSPMYGTAEELVGRFARELDIVDELILATKVWSDGRSAGESQMARSIELLGREPLDIMLIHNLRDWRTHYRTLREWQEQGRLRHIGVSHSRSAAHDEVERVLRSERFDVLQINYNVADTHADQRLLPLAYEQGLAVLINEPFSKGDLFARTRDRALPEWAADMDANSWAQLFLKFIIGHPAVTCALPATTKPRHVVDNTRAMYGRVPDEAQRRRIAAYVREL